MALVPRLDHINITVRDLEAVTSFFLTLGLRADGDPQIMQGCWLEDVIGIDGAQVKVVMLRTPDADTSIELSQFIYPVHDDGPQAAPANELGLRSIAFEVGDVQATVARLAEDGFGLVRAIVNYEDVYRLCYVRGPEGIIVMLAQSLS